MTELPPAQHTRNGKSSARSATAALRLVHSDTQRSSPALPEFTSPATSIGIRVPAGLTQLTMLRALAETVCLIADFTIDAATDIRVALDEVATTLMLTAVPGAEIECEFTYDERAMTVRVASVSHTATPFDEREFGWNMLHALTDSVRTITQPCDTGAPGFPIEVTFHRSQDGLHG
ncbi:ATP-binding protein [Nocardia sp. NBC_01327]|uniref:ATP-binding protein n=1 Tax=Nocardia sp. NBC_01327 TaxID=2903593 RepID=UPI002E166504|nr:ATP-binding protein [Nocardia sp. NBC_01327]